MNNEPVAWHYPGGKPDQCTTDKAYAEKDPAWTPMYYKHEWVGLTELEKAEITSLKWWDWEDTFDIEGFIRAIEAKLKERNT